MTTPTLRQLRYAEALARLGHFGRAAETCAISQPALSVQIRDLEAALGSPLFERGPRGVLPTALGARMLPRIRAILRQVDELGELARSARGELSGQLRLGVIPTVAPYFLPRLIPAVARRYPGLDLQIRETLTPRLVEELTAGALDCAILALPLDAPGCAAVPLFSEEFLLVRPVAQADDPVPDREDLREMRLMLLEEGHCFRDQALSFCTPAGGGAAARDMLDASALSTLVQMVGAGLGVTLVPEMAVGVETRSAAVAVARFPEPRPRRDLGLIWRQGSPLAGPLAEFARIVAGARPLPEPASA